MTTPAAGASAEAFDVIFVGGGLASGLTALALHQRQPRLRMAMIEAQEALGGNHTWSFHSSDVDDEGARLLAPLVSARMDNVTVAFPDHERRLSTGYAVMMSRDLDRSLRAIFAHAGKRLLLGERVARMTDHDVTLASGQRLTGTLVCDGRGPAPPPQWAENQGFQKFLGLEITLANPGAIVDPTTALAMDARVAQVDGFRFMYVLPLGHNRLLIEDTSYADTPSLDRDHVRARIFAYLERRGARDVEVVREEIGVLGIPWTDDGVPPLGAPIRLGARGGWFHPTTGYTVPSAVRVALTVATHAGGAGSGGTVDVTAILEGLARLRRERERQARFARRLNRLLFRAGAPGDRWMILSRFYRLPQACIERFFALSSTPADRARILFGRPPRGVSLRAAFAALQTV